MYFPQRVRKHLLKLERLCVLLDGASCTAGLDASRQMLVKKKRGTHAAFNWKFSSNAQLRAALQMWKEEEFCFPSWSGTQNQRTRKELSLITDVMWRHS